ncbi:hypothetical protein B6A10_15975 [Flavobacterium sp. L1I52]|uniref:Nucleotide-diphospho-sugar transferase n=1 Tax=Flavobacterium pokkalii TaxID=1940408 RepID=A0ABR7UVE7_9FLAO|nr:nucleotide-diphospho-sugar transferase [Flavobacterium pokkalii]MBD0726669.1 hypothetical protein [Flavobacterium pokkalii]
MYQVKSPILFLIFNRPKETQILFNAIRDVKPKKLYVAADGPRKNGKDDLACKETKAILNQIDWECELITLFREENLGCGKAVSSAITWFFNNEEEGIILEDDCLPSNDFFRFVDAMLEKYRKDERVGHICGTNFQGGILRGNGDYYFSKTSPIWGWASWRRVWNKYDFKMSNLDSVYKKDLLVSLTDNKKYKRRIYDSFFETKRGFIDTWDYQFFYTNLLNNHLCVISNYNLISNIGFTDDATHTFDVNNPAANMAYGVLPDTITHPDTVLHCKEADIYELNRELAMSFSLKSEIVSILKRFGLFNSLQLLKRKFV